MKKKAISLLLLSLTITLFVFIGIAHRYPQGESYYTGIWIFQDIGPDKPEYANEPSPVSNPPWVRFFQDHSGWIVFAGLAGLVASFLSWPHKYTIEQVFNARGR